jgi:antitoxin component YwqK of YwqJK toxin-antitoxin module
MFSLTQLPTEVVQQIYKMVMEELISKLKPIYYTNYNDYYNAKTPCYHICYTKWSFYKEKNSKLIFKNNRTWIFINDKLYVKANTKEKFVDDFVQIFYSNGNLARELFYKNGMKNGLDKKYYKNGNLKKKSFRKNNICEGISTEYHLNGIIKSETPYKNRKKNGIYTAYYNNGTLSHKLLFTNGKCELIEHHPLVKQIDNNIKNGVYKSFHKNGTLHVEAFYVNGVRQGITRIFNENGSLRKEINH